MLALFVFFGRQDLRADTSRVSMSGSEVSITGFMFGFMDKVRMAVHSSLYNQ